MGNIPDRVDQCGRDLRGPRSNYWGQLALDPAITVTMEPGDTYFNLTSGSLRVLNTAKTAWVAMADAGAILADSGWSVIVEDEFAGLVIDVTYKWVVTTIGAASGAIMAIGDVPNGIVVLVTDNNAGDSVRLDTGFRKLTPTRTPVAIFIARMPSVVSDDFSLRMGFEVAEGVDHAIFVVDKAVLGALNIFTEVLQGGLQTYIQDTGQNIGTVYLTFVVAHNPTDHRTYFYINGVQVGVSPANALDETLPLRPYLALTAQAGGVFYLGNVDFVRAYQRRFV